MNAHTLTLDDLKEMYPMHETKWNDLIHKLTNIAESFIDRALGIDPTQQAQAAHQLSTSKDSGKSVKLNRNPLTNPYNAASNTNSKK